MLASAAAKTFATGHTGGRGVEIDGFADGALKGHLAPFATVAVIQTDIGSPKVLTNGIPVQSGWPGLKIFAGVTHGQYPTSGSNRGLWGII